eukprot:tig00021517_g21984.t1
MAVSRDAVLVSARGGAALPAGLAPAPGAVEEEESGPRLVASSLVEVAVEAPCPLRPTLVLVVLENSSVVKRGWRVARDALAAALPVLAAAEHVHATVLVSSNASRSSSLLAPPGSNLVLDPSWAPAGQEAPPADLPKRVGELGAGTASSCVKAALDSATEALRGSLRVFAEALRPGGFEIHLVFVSYAEHACPDHTEAPAREQFEELRNYLQARQAARVVAHCVALGDRWDARFLPALRGSLGSEPGLWLASPLLPLDPTGRLEPESVAASLLARKLSELFAAIASGITALRVDLVVGAPGAAASAAPSSSSSSPSPPEERVCWAVACNDGSDLAVGIAPFALPPEQQAHAELEMHAFALGPGDRAQRVVSAAPQLVPKLVVRDAGTAAWYEVVQLFAAACDLKHEMGAALERQAARELRRPWLARLADVLEKARAPFLFFFNFILPPPRVPRARANASFKIPARAAAARGGSAAAMLRIVADVERSLQASVVPLLDEWRLESRETLARALELSGAGILDGWRLRHRLLSASASASASAPGPSALAAALAKTGISPR